MLKIIFLIISLYVIFKILKKRKTNKSMGKTDFSKVISTWKDNKQEPLYSSRHESTPSSEKAAEEIVTKHEKIARKAIKNEELE